ncbi:MAG: aminopeptidase P family protein [Spirochaetes bacterium]|nr:aminopeptidase P family protein [Spirochaetota bacterium]
MSKKTFLPADESSRRLSGLKARISSAGLDAVMLFNGMDQFYYTGTIQNGFLFVPAAGDPLYFVRRNIERARTESPFTAIHPYSSFRDAKAVMDVNRAAAAKVGIDEGDISVSLMKMLTKYFPQTVFADAAAVFKKQRAVKSAYEIAKMRSAGRVGHDVMAAVPSMLREGMTEWELGLMLFHKVAELGQSPSLRFSGGIAEFFLGNVCFGDSSLAPTSFDGPGGLAGLSPAHPYTGSNRKLKRGDLVYIDIGFPFEEYYVDKTRVFSFGAKPAPDVLKAHELCLRVQEAIRARLKPGEIPSQIYDDIYATILADPIDAENFMGYGQNRVKFFGHGLGLVVNEYPVIAPKFDEPLEENMTLALEPKKGLTGIGMVGIENTYRVTSAGGENLTEDDDSILVVE